MLRNQIETNDRFKVTDECTIAQFNGVDTFSITDTYSIRGTHFLVIDADMEDIPWYEFSVALRNNTIESV